jgi:predicted phage tail protein
MAGFLLPEETMTEAIRNVRLYGALGSRFGRRHRLAVASPAEAVRALCVLLKGFEAYLMHAKDRGVAFGVLVGKRHLKEEELGYPSGSEDIRIAPVIIGSKQGGLFQTIIGAVLIVVGFVLGPATFIGSALISAGISMVIGGVTQLLSPHPKGQSGNKPSNSPNYAFNGVVNTEAQGNPIPVFYGGPKKIGSAVISAGIYANDGVYVPTTAASSGATGFYSSAGSSPTGSGGSGGGSGGPLSP